MNLTALRRLVAGDRAFVVVGLLAPAAWIVHFSAGLVLVPVACDTGRMAPLHALTVICALAGGAGLVLLRRRGSPATDAGELRRWAGSLAAFFIVLIVLEGILPWVIDPCL